MYCDQAGRRRMPSARRARRLGAAESALATQKPSVALLGALHRHPPHSQPAHDRPDRAPRQPECGDQRRRARRGGTVGTRGCRLDFARRVARHEPARPNRAPQRTPSARGGIASSLRSKPASAAATRSHQRAARYLDMPSVSNAQSARQGRNRDNRSRQTHSSQSDRSDYVRLKYP